MLPNYRIRRFKFRLMAPLLFIAGLLLPLGLCVGLVALVYTYLWPPLAYLLVIVLTPCLAFGVALYPSSFERYVSGPAERRDLRWLQSKRDRWVRKHTESLLSGEMPFCLYLRPFISSGAIRVVTSGLEIGLANRKARFRGPSRGTDWQLRWEDLEAILAEAVLSIGPLVALGRPGEQFGAGRWKTEEGNWQELVSDLFGMAELIFVIPSPHEGTLWELQQLLAVDDWLAKTVFVVPSSGASFGYDTTTADKSFRHGAALNPMIEVSVLREEALEALRVVGASSAVHRAAAHEYESFLMLSRDRQVSLMRPLERRTGEDQREPSEYLPGHSSFVTLERDHVRGLVHDLRAHARRPR
jgi:hypothetical protein